MGARSNKNTTAFLVFVLHPFGALKHGKIDLAYTSSEGYQQICTTVTGSKKNSSKAFQSAVFCQMQILFLLSRL